MILGTKIFIIIHEIGHYKDFENNKDEMLAIMTEEDFDKFAQKVIEMEIKTDEYSEKIMHKLNKLSDININHGITKQNLDLLTYSIRYKSFLGYFHNAYIKNKNKYKTFSDLIKSIAFGELKLNESYINKNRII